MDTLVQSQVYWPEKITGPWLPACSPLQTLSPETAPLLWSKEDLSIIGQVFCMVGTICFNHFNKEQSALCTILKDKTLSSPVSDKAVKFY